MEPPAERVLRLRRRRAGLVGADSLDLGAGAGGGHRGGVAPPNFLHAFLGLSQGVFRCPKTPPKIQTFHHIETLNIANDSCIEY